MEIIKAIIPAAGLGTRFLPYTNVIPKEMLPILNKPAIQYIVEESLESSIQQFLMIVSKGKYAIADHFDVNPELEQALKEQDKLELLAGLQKITKAAFFSYIRQPEALGLGHAILLGRHYIGKEYFGVLLPDEIIFNKTPALSQLIKIARQERATVIAVQEVPVEAISSYGIVGIKKQITPSLFQVSQVVEKPDQKNAPSNLAIIGRYVLSHKIFNSLENTEVDHRGELQLTDAIGHMMRSNNEKVFAYKVQGTRYDIGNPLGWVKAIIGCALQDPRYRPYLNDLLSDQNFINSMMYDAYTKRPTV